MTPELYEQAGELFDQALEFAPDDQRVFLLQACGQNDELRELVEGMLAQHRANDDFLAQPALNVAAQMLAQQTQVSRAGKIISRYKILSQLGTGGMGEVWLAEDAQLRRKVALKLLPDRFAGEPEHARRFEIEARAASATSHPNIVTIYEIGKANATFYIAQEYVEGETLRSRIQRGPLPPLEALSIAAQIANALAAAHAAGIIHRDIKPENVMLRHDGFVKVLDFGLARIQPVAISSNRLAEALTLSRNTAPGLILGTVSYMSPEQTRGEKLDARSDQWSLGVVLYEMLTGLRPFDGNSTPEVFVAILERQPKPLGDSLAHLPAQIDQILHQLLAKDADQRYASSAQLADELKRMQRRLELDAEREVSRAGDNAPPPTQAQTLSGSSAPSSQLFTWRQSKQNRKLRFAMVGLFLLAIVSVAGAYLFLRTPAITSSSKYSGTPISNTAIDSIAVLPFHNFSGNKELTYLSDGLSQSLIDRLSQLPQLKVISRSSSFKFRGENIDLRNVAAQLGVRAILTGSIKQIGQDIVIRFDLMDATEDRHLIGGDYQRKLSNLIGVQHEIAQAASEKLRVNLTDTQSQRFDRNITEDSEAYRYYLNGLVELNSPQDVRGKALDYFEQAVALDPEFAAAHTEIAWIYVGRTIGSDNPHELMPKAKAAIERALALNPDLAKAHAVRAVILGYEFNWVEAEREYAHAIELNPNLDFTRDNYAFFLSVVGRYDEALAELEQQSVRDPVNRRRVLLFKGTILAQARKFDAALQVYWEAQALDPDKQVSFSSFAYAYAGKGSYREATEYYKKSVERLGGEQKYSQSLVYLAATYAKMPEKRQESRAILKRIETMTGYRSPAILAIAYSALDDYDKAMELLEQAYLTRDPLLRYVGCGYEYDELRTDPRFQALLQRLKLPI